MRPYTLLLFQDTPNPYQVALLPGDGFCPPEVEQGRLEEIDNRLRALLPAEDFEQIASTPRSTTSQNTQVTKRVSLAHNRKTHDNWL